MARLAPAAACRRAASPRPAARAVFGLGLLVLALASAAGCDHGRGARDNQLVVWESYTNEEHKVFLELVQLYRERHQRPGSPAVVVQRVPFDGLLSKLITAAIAKQTPDICRVDVGHIGRLAYGGVAAPLDALGAREHAAELLPIAEQSNSVTMTDEQTGRLETHLYGVSDQLTCVALYYNKDLFAAAGIEAPPRTLTELIAVGKRLGDPAAGRYGLGLNNSLWWHLPFLYIHGADVLTPDNLRSRLSEPQAIEAFRFLRQVYAEGVEAGAWKAGAINPDQGFVNGKYAMVVSGPWNLKTFKGVNYGVSLIPGAGDAASATNVGGTSMIVLRNSRKQQAAFDLLRFLTSYEAQKLWAEKTDQLSVNRRVNEELAQSLTPAMQVFMQQLLHARPRPRLPNYDQLENVVNPIFYSILDGKLGAAEGLAQASRLIEEQVVAELE